MKPKRYILVNWEEKTVTVALGEDGKGAIAQANADFGAEEQETYDSAFEDKGTDFVQLQDEFAKFAKGE